MNDLELRLRQRIDTLLDRNERLENQLAELRLLNKKHRGRILRARESRDRWRDRAAGEEWARKWTRNPANRVFPTKTCLGCGCRYDEKTPKCRQCTYRHSTRKRSERSAA